MKLADIETEATLHCLKMNTRYVAYAAANGRTVEEQLSRDRQDMPGTTLACFRRWEHERLNEFAAEHPEAMAFAGTILRDHCAFTEWLRQRFLTPLAA